MPPPVLADVYIPGKTAAIRTTPGRTVKMVGGRAEIREPRDMPHMLRREDATVEVARSHVDWLPDWLRACGDDIRNCPKAKLILPDGFSLGPAPEYILYVGKPGPVVSAPEAEPEPEPEPEIEAESLEEFLNLV